MRLYMIPAGRLRIDKGAVFTPGIDEGVQIEDLPRALRKLVVGAEGRLHRLLGDGDEHAERRIGNDHPAVGPVQA